jgi:chemosensory pili system protein ChpA (sensor histidine kinase/response regulator)
VGAAVPSERLGVTEMNADPRHPSAPSDIDLSAVAWVHDELRRTLEASHKLLRRFLRESAAHAGSDVSARDLGPLRLARSQVHQSAGALALVGLAPAAELLSACEAALRLALEKPARLDAALLDKIELASFAVIDFLGRRLAGKPVSSLLLFPQTRALLEAVGAERVHPADLWDHPWEWRNWDDDAPLSPRAADAAGLALLEQLTLASMKSPGAASLARLGDFCASLAAGAGSPQDRSLWQLAAAVFESQSVGLLQADVFSKRLASRLMSHARDCAAKATRPQNKGSPRTCSSSARRATRPPRRSPLRGWPPRVRPMAWTPRRRWTMPRVRSAASTRPCWCRHASGSTRARSPGLCWPVAI